MTKDASYERLDDSYERSLRQDVKIDCTFDRTVLKFSFHDETLPIGLRLIDSAGVRNAVVCTVVQLSSFSFQETPSRYIAVTVSKIAKLMDYVVVAERYVSSFLDVLCLRQCGRSTLL